MTDEHPRSNGPNRPNRRKRRQRRGRRQRQLVRLINQADSDLHAIADRLGVDLVALAELADEQRTRRALETLGQLDALRNRQLIGRYRVHAVARLVDLAGRADEPELARRAAVDLLKTELRRDAPGRPDAAASDPTRTGRSKGGAGADCAAGADDDHDADGDAAAVAELEAVLDQLRHLGDDRRALRAIGDEPGDGA